MNEFIEVLVPFASDKSDQVRVDKDNYLASGRCPTSFFSIKSKLYIKLVSARS